MKRMVVLFGLIVLAGFGVCAETLSLEQVRVLALANSRSLAKSNNAIHSLALDERSRLFSLFPSLSLGANASMSLWSGSNAAPIQNPINTLSAGASVSLSQRIFEGGKSSIQKAINEIAMESARKDTLSEYFNVLDSADSAYYAALEAAATLEAEELSLQTAISSLAIAEIRQASGMINQGDYIKALADKESRENSRNQSRRNLALAATRLKALTGLSEIPPLQDIDFSRFEELIVRLGTITDEEGDVLYNQFWKLLVTANPSLSKVALANQRAEQNLTLAKRAFSPTLGASFSTGLSFSPNNGVEMNGGRVSLSASIPIDFWSINNSIEKSKLSLDSSNLDYVSAEIQLQTELQSALLNIFAYAGSVLSTRRSLEYTEKHFEYVMERYRLSQSSVSDLGEASSLLINSRNNHTKSRYGFLQSLSKLRSLEAIDDEERLVNLLMSR